MDKKQFEIITQPLLKYNRKQNRYFVRRECVGQGQCDLCEKIIRSPGWDLYPWKLWSRRPSIKIVCKCCRANKHIPIKRSDCETQVDSEL